MKAFCLIRYVPVLFLAVIVSACSSLPVIKPIDPVLSQDSLHRCNRPFLEVPYRFVHAMEVSLSDRTPGTVMGITLFDPRSETIHSAILTLEGFVLFDARHEKGVQVNRAVPPFDAPLFAANMMEDIRLIFLAPKGRLLKAGTGEDQAAVCRYEADRDGTVDVVIRPDGTWEVNKYGDHQELLRRINATAMQNGIPGMLELTGFFTVNYSIRMRLISAEPVSADALQLRSGQKEDEE